jgi:hypothetical protein
MHQKLLRAFQILDQRATMDDVLSACRNLFLHSDEYHVARHPFEHSEVETVAKAIYEFILDPGSTLNRKIEFNANRPLEGKSIGYYKYASMFSEDMLYQNLSPPVESLDLEALRLALETFLVGLFFRYQACIDARWFPVSLVLDYIDVVEVLLSRERRDSDFRDAVLATLDAFRSLEPRYRLEQKAEHMLAQHQQKKSADKG